MITTIKKVVVLLIISIFCTQLAFATKGGINVGPYYDQIPVAGGVIDPNGWVYALGCPADVQVMSRFYTGSPDYNFMIRAFYRAGDFSTPEQAIKNAQDWAKALAAAPFPNKVYFVPMNEFNNPVEGFFNRNGTLVDQSRFDNFLLYLEQLQIQLNALNVRNNRMFLLSPTIDPFFLSDHPEQEPYIRQIPWGSFDGTAISAYLQYNGSTIDSNAPSIKRGVYQDLAAVGVDVSGDVYIVETGVIRTEHGKVLYRENSSQIQDGLRNQTPSWTNNSNVKSVIIFSYNPDPGGDRSHWIFSDSGVLSALNALPDGPPVSASTPPDTSINLSEIVGSCGAEVLEPIEVDKGDQNKRESLSLRARALIQAAAIIGQTTETIAALTNIVPGSTGSLPDFTEESTVFEQVLPGTLPRKFQPIKRGELPENNRIGIELDNGVAPATVKAAVVVDGERTDERDNQIDGKSIAYAANDVQWAKPLRSLNTSYEALLTPEGKLTLNEPNKISLVRPPEILKPGPVSNADNTGVEVDNLTTTTRGEIVLDETLIPLLVRITASILEALGLVNTEEQLRKDQFTELDNPGGLISENYISDFTKSEHKQPGKNLIDSYLPRQTKPDYSKNAQIRNDYSGPGGLSQINLVSNEAAGMKEGYNKLFCSSLPRGTVEYQQRCGNGQPKTNTSASLEGMYKDPALTSQCSLNEQTIDLLAKRLGDGQGVFRGYFYGREQGILAERNLRNYWGYIQDAAVRNNINPLLAFTFFIEESGAGGFTNATLVGCKYERGTGRPSPVGFSKDTVDQQMNCLSNYLRDIPDFDRFMCTYSGERQPDNSYNCNRQFKNNPNFPGMIRFWRDEIIRFTPSLPSSCRIPELDNYISSVE